jgi:hypothetical protein
MGNPFDFSSIKVSNRPILSCSEFLQASDNSFVMGKLDNILYLLLPEDLMHTGFELTDRSHRQHVLGFLVLALCTLSIQRIWGQLEAIPFASSVQNLCILICPKNQLFQRIVRFFGMIWHQETKIHKLDWF